MGNAVRMMWTFMTILSCIWAFVALLAGDASSAIAIVLAGIAFHFMSGLPYSDLPDE